jgi:hypothetical protein
MNPFRHRQQNKLDRLSPTIFSNHFLLSEKEKKFYKIDTNTFLAALGDEERYLKQML